MGRQSSRKGHTSAIARQLAAAPSSPGEVRALDTEQKDISILIKLPATSLALEFKLLCAALSRGSRCVNLATKETIQVARLGDDVAGRAADRTTSCCSFSARVS